MRGIWLVFGTNEKPMVAVADVSLEVPRGRFVVIVGPSGCGKSSLLRMMGGLTAPTAGEIRITPQKGNARAAPTGMVFQEPSVFPWLTVEANIAYGLKVLGYSKRERREAAAKYLAAMKLPERVRHAFPHQLSGGMRQRVAIARAFATRPDVLLMDEPFSALDELTKLSLQQELIKLWEEDRTTVVFITHSVDEAIALGDEITVMAANPGRILDRFEVPFGRPREILSLRSQPAYGEFASRIWNLLRPGAGGETP
jgi:NitT/TauT family transport system ATP-binding protein